MEKRKHIWSLLFLLVLMAFTFFLLFRQLNIQDLMDTITGFEPVFLVAGMGMVVLFLCCEAFVFRIVLKGIDHPIRRISALVYAGIDFYFSCITPSANGGQPAQAYYMTKDGVPLSKSGITILVYGMMYKAVLLLFGMFALCMVPSYVFGESTLLMVLFLFGAVCDVAVFVLCLFAIFHPDCIRRPVYFCIHILAKLRLITDKEKAMVGAEKQLLEYHEASMVCKKTPNLVIKTFCITFVQRAIQFSIGYLVFLGFGLTGHSYFELFSIQVLIAFSADSLPLPGAVGASEAVHLAMYSHVYQEASLRSGAMLLTRGLNYYFLLS
ncbi:MAG TPA: hypothetical protein DCY75_06025, partial [Clostridiales bacterium]|nr:hypothetical protein [Clostridiales bacterium]